MFKGTVGSFLHHLHPSAQLAGLPSGRSAATLGQVFIFYYHLKDRKTGSGSRQFLAKPSLAA